MMKRILKLASVLFFLFGILMPASAQDAENETFVRNLLRYLERSNWEASETGALERHLFAYEWQNLAGVDPEIVARALSYGKEHGINSPEDLAGIAHQISLSIREMLGLGLEPREALRMSTNAVRTIATERIGLRNTEEIPDLAQTFREQMRRQIAGAQQSSLRRQAQRRVSRPGRSDTWSPPTPEERAGGGSSSIPSGPGKPSGPASESSGGNGGR